MDSVIKQYTVVVETMEEVHRTTHDEYGLKAGGVLTAIEKFDVLFGLNLGHLLFSAAEETSKILQAKHTSVQEVVSPVNVTHAYYQRQRQNWALDKFYESTVALGKSLQIERKNYPDTKNIQGGLTKVASLTNSLFQSSSIVSNTLKRVIYLFNS